ncbi:hypothetical protein [Vibrio sp. HN007]|uniref:hypothetical protein n=1 Tax=Vibrio iocasae TaxID=3098914 RepID=UPI0035D406A8
MENKPNSNVAPGRIQRTTEQEAELEVIDGHTLDEEAAIIDCELWGELFAEEPPEARRKPRVDQLAWEKEFAREALFDRLHC